MLRYPELRCKGADTSVVVRWLTALVEAHDIQNADLATLLWASNSVGDTHVLSYLLDGGGRPAS